MTRVLVTGGTGYIGSHTVVELLGAGYEVIIVDNLSNSSPKVIDRVEQITGKRPFFYEADVRDSVATRRLFDEHEFDAVIHFAGLKAVGESVEKPLAYYRNNIDSTLTLCETMQSKGVKKLIFSSSATVYGTPESLPLTEESRVGVGITNPYGQTKFMIEQMLKDLAVVGDWEISLLRYFNPVGAHESGLIGEDPSDTPNNLLPYVSRVAVGKLGKVRVFGNNYDTPDGTGVRDYIHVVDLARGHLAALEHLKPGIQTYNLGTGKGISVLEIIKAFSKAAGKDIPYEIVGRRTGDVDACYADPSKANRELGWKAQESIETACEDAWLWQSNNPDGFRK
jgi:UDP-glucose 4-epimerase